MNDLLTEQMRIRMAMPGGHEDDSDMEDEDSEETVKPDTAKN